MPPGMLTPAKVSQKIWTQWRGIAEVFRLAAGIGLVRYQQPALRLTHLESCRHLFYNANAAGDYLPAACCHLLLPEQGWWLPQAPDSAGLPLCWYPPASSLIFFF